VHSVRHLASERRWDASLVTIMLRRWWSSSLMTAAPEEENGSDSEELERSSHPWHDGSTTASSDLLPLPKICRC
jgi:hypothetical protein